MATLMRAFDWTTTSLGRPEDWPSGLRTAVRLLLNSHHPMHIFWGAEAIFFYNDGFMPSAGPERHPSALGHPASESWGEIWPVIGSEVAKVRNGGGHTWYEDQHVPILREGRTEDAYWTYGFSPIDDETAPNSIGGVISILTETTKRKALENSLRGLNQSLQEQVEAQTAERNRLWNNTQDIQVVINGEGRFQAVNPAFNDILGWSQEEVIGRTVFEFIVPDDKTDTDKALAHARDTALPIFENRYRHKDGGFRWISWVAAPEGSLIYASGRHITAEKEQAEALRHAEEALRQSQKMEAVGQLTGGLAHDFNNLLAGISGSLEMMQTRISQGRLKDIEKYMVAGQGASKRAAALTHRLLAFSRRQTLTPKATDVNALTAGMLDLVQRTVGPSVEVQHVGVSGLWLALVDPSQLENALLNLCINARDAMPEGGKITIETGNRWIDRQASKTQDIPEGQYLSLCVSDTGTGMTPDVIAKAFDPFFTTKPIGEGTGLGLSMIYGFARQSGGQVRIYSEVGDGTMVCVYLPRHRGEAELDISLVDAIRVPFAKAGETVLVVDDEPTVRMLVTDILEDLGYTAIEAADSAGGLRVLQSDVQIDLLVTDVGLPGGMNGRQMADAARVSRPDLKVMFITGFAENALLNNGQLEPGMSVLTKPFAVDTLAARIRELIIK